jgi:hypothetical protein
MFLDRFNSLFVTCVRVADNSDPGIDCQDPFQPPGCILCAVSNDHLSGVLAEANADTAAVME